MTTPSFAGNDPQPQYHEADFGHSDEAHALRDHVSATISDAGCDCGMGPTLAEQHWTDLMSARPRFDHNPMHHLPEQTTAVGPSPETFKYVAGPLQPPEIEDHALDLIQEHWKENAIDESATAANNVSRNLKQLSGSWTGEDFDYLTELFEEAIKELNVFHDDGQKVCEILERQEDSLFSLQGGDVGETPVPPAQFRHTGGSRLDKPGTHMRPPFHMGPCKIISDDDAMDMHGIDQSFRDEVHTRVDTRTEEIIEERVGSKSGSELDAINESELVNQAQDQARQ